MPDTRRTTMNDTAMTAQQKIDALTKDFLERDENNSFVRIRKSGRLGWESTLPEDGAYSEYMLHPDSQEDLIRNAYRVASDMITVMDAPFKVNIAITPDNSSTDAKTVWVATKVFDDPDLPTGKKLDTFVGLAVHEGCHLLYTKFDEGRKCSNGIVHSLQNIIEDERIERECGESKPGLANFLKASKYYYFDKYREDMVKAGRLSGLDTFQRLMNTILAYVRYPKSLDLDDLQEFADVMLKVKEILLPYPTSTSASTDAAEKIYEVMKEFMQQQEQQNPQSSGGSQSGEQSGEAQEGQAGETGQGQEGNSGPSRSEKQMEKSFSGMKPALDNIVSEPKCGLGESDQSETVKEDGGRVGMVCEGRLEKGSQKGTYIERGTENRDVYDEALARVRPHVPAVSRILRLSSTEYKMNLRGMRSGVLDTGKLAEAFQGVPTVYMREGEVKTKKVAVCILIDESGSMWGSGETAARDTAILLNEALDKVPNVDLYIYGHTASRSTTSLYVYRERNFHRKYVLGSTDSRAGNHDSIAIREACARVRKSTKENCLFFMISDGAPNESTDMVRKAVQDVEKDGFSVVAISIDPYYDPSTMYTRNVTLTDLNTLAVELGKLVRKAVMDNTGKKMNY